MFPVTIEKPMLYLTVIIFRHSLFTDYFIIYKVIKNGINPFIFLICLVFVTRLQVENNRFILSSQKLYINPFFYFIHSSSIHFTRFSNLLYCGSTKLKHKNKEEKRKHPYNYKSDGFSLNGTM